MKMEKLPMCRLCLVENVRMYVVVNKNLQALYEKLTDVPIELSVYTISPKVHVSISDAYQTESDVIKEELPDVCDGQDNDNQTVSGFENLFIPTHHSESDDTPPQYSQSDPKDHVPLMQFKIETEEDQEITKTKRKANDTKTAGGCAKNTTIDERRTNLEDTITAEKKKTEDSGTAGSEEMQNRRSDKPVSKFREPIQTNNLREQTGEKPFNCDICGCTFSFKRLMIEHTRFHTCDKPYKCDICQNNFRLKSTLYSHIREHTGNKPYKCKICRRSFRQLIHLKYHSFAHTPERLHIHDCQRHLHDRVHTGEKPYKCNVCQHDFKSRGGLKFHLLTHTSDKPTLKSVIDVCNICKCGFCYTYLLDHSYSKTY